MNFPRAVFGIVTEKKITLTDFSMFRMATDHKKRYWAPTSQALPLQPVRILNNSLTDYNQGNIDEKLLPIEDPTLESLPGFPSFL